MWIQLFKIAEFKHEVLSNDQDTNTFPYIRAHIVQAGFGKDHMATTSYQRVASSVIEMLEELSAQVIKRTVQLTGQDVAHSKKSTSRNKDRRSRKDMWHKHRVSHSGKKEL